MSTYGYLQRQKYEGQKRQAQESEDRRRTQEMEDKQMALMDAEIANLQDQGGANEAVRQAAAKDASDYLGKWNAALNKAEGVYSSAISEVDKAGNLIDKAYGDLGELDAVGQEIKGEWDTFKTNFEGMQGDLLEGGREAMGMRGELRRSFMDLSRSDEEGAAGRAMADVSGMAERGRQAEAMRLQGMGIDPTSGRSRSLMRESRNREALAGGLAANKARLAEKDRAASLTAQGLQLIDPGQDITAAGQIQKLSSDLLAQRSQMATTKAGMGADLARSRGALATTKANIGSGIARDIAAPQGEYGAAQRGLELANTGAGVTPAGGGGTVADYAASIGARGFETSDRAISDKLAKHVGAAKKGQDMRTRFYG